MPENSCPNCERAISSIWPVTNRFSCANCGTRLKSNRGIIGLGSLVAGHFLAVVVAMFVSLPNVEVLFLVKLAIAVGVFPVATGLAGRVWRAD